MTPFRPLADRFTEKYCAAENGCWLWTGSLSSKGYGLIRHEGQSRRASHVSLLLVGKPQPEDKPYACHTCDTPNCVNPAHLYWGTPLENQADRLVRTGHHYRDRSHCKRGHELTEANWINHSNGHRQCRQCQQISTAERLARKTA